MKFYRHLTLVLATLLMATSTFSAPQNTSLYIPLVSNHLSPIVSPLTTVLSPATMSKLISISDNGMLIFANSTPDLARLKAGSIIVAAPSTSAPYGLMHKVTAISTASGKVILQTVQAALDEVFNQIDLSVDGPVPVASGTTILSVSPQSALPCSSDFAWNIPVSGGLQLDGHITISHPTFHFEVQKGKGIFDRHVRFTTSEQATINVKVITALGASSVGFNADLVKCRSPIPITIWIGIVPVSFTPELKLTTGVSLSQVKGTTLAYTCEVSVTGTFTAGADYLNGQMTVIHTGNLTADLIQMPPAEAGGALKVTAGLSVAMLVAGWVGPEIGINAYARWDVATDPLAIYVGLEAEADLTIDLWFYSFHPASATFTLIERRLSRDIPPTPTLTPTPTPPHYTMIDLHPLDGVFSDAEAIQDISNNVVGEEEMPNGTIHAVLWISGTASIDLDTLSKLNSSNSIANDINDTDGVAGEMTLVSGVYHAVLWAHWSTGVATDLGTLGGLYSSAYGINNVNQVIGRAEASGNIYHAFLWQNGSMADLGTLGGSASEAHAINNAGQVVGQAQTANGSVHAFLWQNGSMKDLGTLGGSNSTALSINESGQVVGYSDTSSGVYHAFLWANGTMKDLGTLGGSNSAAIDINNAGQIVGQAYTPSGAPHAFFWTNGVMSNLGTLGGSDSFAHGINDNGQVIGQAQTAGGTVHAFLAIPLS